MIFKIIFKTNLTDPQVSVKIYERKTFLKLSNKLISPNDGMKSTEILLYYLAINKKIVEIPSIYYNRNTSKNVSVKNFFRISFNCFLSLISIWFEIKKKEKLGLIKKNLLKI